MKNYEKIITACVILFFVFMTAKCVKQNIGNSRAAESGVCIKAHVLNSLYRSTDFNIDAYYNYQGKRYHGTLLSKNRIKQDSAWIRILPENPNYLAWCREDSLGFK
jgi:hypothetical protein